MRTPAGIAEDILNNYRKTKTKIFGNFLSQSENSKTIVDVLTSIANNKTPDLDLIKKIKPGVS